MKKNCVFLLLVGFASVFIIIYFSGISFAQTAGGKGAVSMLSGCWNFSTNETCANTSDEYNCIWRSDQWGGWEGWCEKTVQKNCWQYNTSLLCLNANCSWDTYGYCYKKNCWDFKDETSCEQANITYGINCKWETMGTANTSDDYCYELGCWSYNTNETCSEISGCSWTSGGGWCSELGCWNYDTETACDAQENCEWEGSSYCRYKSCWDFDNTTCENSTAHPGLNCRWDDTYKYCYELGCWNYQNESACTADIYNLSCAWNNTNNYCYSQSCYDYTNKTACESTSDNLNCYWDSVWKSCYKLDCRTFDNQISCENTNDTMDCRWKKTGWCSDYNCWDFNTSNSCINNTYNLDCLWSNYSYCTGDYNLNCWQYSNEGNCTTAGCTWKPGYCYEKGCRSYNNESECTNSTLHPNLVCGWFTTGYCSGSSNYTCWNYSTEASCITGNCTWINYSYCSNKACWNYKDNTSCLDTTDNLTCEWDNLLSYCYKKSCESYNDSSSCTNLTAHPDLDCLWSGSYCYEAGCSNNQNSTSCENANCKWQWGSGYCEENTTSIANCWSFTNNASCSDYDECIWEVWGSCQDKNACWKQTSEEDCNALNTTGRCAWNSEYDYCYERGCWYYTDATNCTKMGCKWDGSNCYEEGCWKYNNKTACLDLNDTLTCKWENYYYCSKQGCWDYTTDTECLNTTDTLDCVWQTSGFCEAINSSGENCWQYWNASSCNTAIGCSWNQISWCEEKGPWYYKNNDSCIAAGFNWKTEGGWCNEPSDIQCWNFNQSVCASRNTCRWDNSSSSCVKRECWEFYDNSSCSNAPAELGCSWQSQEASGWCEEINCWNFRTQPECGAHASDMKCNWVTFGWCEEKSCWMFENKSACVNTTDNLDCDWRNAPSGGWCEPEFGRWEVSCWQATNETACGSIDGCRWKTGWCEEKGCRSYNNESECTNSTLHPNINCTWNSNQWGSWCEEKGCWNFQNETACNAHNATMGCTWHTDPWNPTFGWCEEPGCWSYTDNESCSTGTYKGKNCTWYTDPSGFGGSCVMEGCWSLNQTSCTLDANCYWKEESHCERARCWMWDSVNGGNESTCLNYSAIFGLNCTWDNGSCVELHAGCDRYNNDREGCFGTMFCWWDEENKTCNSPEEVGRGSWIIELEEERTNPGCWIFDYETKYCNSSIVDVCKLSNSTGKCVGLSAEVEIKCSNIKESDLCESIPVLSTCCIWKNNKCQADPESTKCYTNIQEPPAGAAFCEDYLAYTDNATCVQIAGEPWFMPCEWDGSNCVFRSEEKFGTKKGCDAITNKKDCEFAGCEWKTDFYCEGTKAVPFGWCEEKPKLNCDIACWACEWKNSTGHTVTAENAKSSCENSALGYCVFTNDTSAPNGIGFCDVSSEIKYIGDCDSDCKACESKPNPSSACQLSNANCKWVNDTTGATTVGGWCYPKAEKSCMEDCFRCYEEKDCIDYGGGKKGTCVWDSDTGICKPKNFDKEICFNGEDDDGDGRTDCDDSDCFSDPFCGAGMISDCWKYDTQSDCISEGNASGCIWITDPWENESWCGLQGENCFLWDGDQSGCSNQPMCQWFPDPKGGFCEVDDSKVQNCFKSTTQGACIKNPDCSWIVDPKSSTGGICKPKVFLCETKTNEADCTSSEWSNRCKWVIDSDTGEGFCEPICFSKDLATQSTCEANANCKWMGGFCDPAEQFGMKMEDCWKYDENRTACAEAKGCEYHTMGKGFCEVNKSIDMDICSVFANSTACNNNPLCSWKGDALDGFCDAKIHECGWYSQNQTHCENNPICAWIGTGSCECTIPWEQGGCNVGTPHGCIDFTNETSCEEQSTKGCSWIGPRCEPICFNYTDSNSCAAEAPLCTWKEGLCEPKIMKIMFQGMEERVFDLGRDEDGGCGPGSGDANIPEELDICGFGMKETPDNYGFGVSVVSLENSALCKGKKIIKRSGEMEKEDVTDSGIGTNTTKLYVYLDTDGNETGNCRLWNNPDSDGWEFFFKYKVKVVDGKVKEKRTAYRCKDGANAEWVAADIKVTGWRTLMCSEIGGMMIAVNKDDLQKFSDLFIPGEEMRVYVATAGKKRTKRTPTDTAGPGYYTPGGVDFKFEDCLTPDVDMDGDGFKSQNDPDCFKFFKYGGFIKHEDCFETGIDEDGDGLADCDDPDCRFAPNCAGKGAALLNDTTAPSLTWKEVEKYPDGAFIKYDTNEPANGTILFYHNDSSCTNISKIIKDPALLDNKTTNDYKNWHDGPIDNFDFNPQRLGYNLTNGTTYYYKLRVCDSSGNCGLSACMNFTTAVSSSKKDCPDCYAIVPGEVGACGVAKQKIDYKNVTDIPLLSGNDTAIIIENVKGRSFDSPNITSGNITTSDGNNIGYVGMNSSEYDKVRSKLGAYEDINCTIYIPKGAGNCNKLWHCPDPVNGIINKSQCIDRSSEATLLNSSGDKCVWRVPCEFSVWISNPADEEEIKGEGGGGGAAVGVCIENWICTEWSACIDGVQTRTCTDQNNCGTEENKPAESQSCEVLPKEREAVSEEKKTEKEVEREAIIPAGAVFGIESTTLYVTITLVVILILLAGVVVYKRKTGS